MTGPNANPFPKMYTPFGTSGTTPMMISSSTASSPAAAPGPGRPPVPYNPPRAAVPNNPPRLGEQKLVKVPGNLQPPFRPRTKTSACLNREIPAVDGLCFQNTDEAQAVMDIAQWRAPKDDDSVPETDEEHREYVKNLVHAFKDMTKAKDTKANAYRKRFTPGNGVYYKDWAIEACAWDIVAKTKSIHANGFTAPIYDKSIVDAIGQTQKWTFGERIDWICQVLKTSKHVGVSLMKNEKNWTTIGAPHKLYSSTLVNCVSNGQRGKWIKDGRGNDQEHQSRPIRGRRTAAEMMGPQDDGVGIDDAIDEDAVGEEVDGQDQEPALKRQKVEHLVSDSEDIGVDSAVEVSPFKKGKMVDSNMTEDLRKKSFTIVCSPEIAKDNDTADDATADDATADDADRKYVDHKDANLAEKNAKRMNDKKDKNKNKNKNKNKGLGFTNYHSMANFEMERDSGSCSSLSDPPDGLFSASPTRNHKVSFSARRVHDAADLDGAHTLARMNNSA